MTRPKKKAARPANLQTVAIPIAGAAGPANLQAEVNEGAAMWAAHIEANYRTDPAEGRMILSRMTPEGAAATLALLSPAARRASRETFADVARANNMSERQAYKLQATLHNAPAELMDAWKRDEISLHLMYRARYMTANELRPALTAAKPRAALLALLKTRTADFMKAQGISEYALNVVKVLEFLERAKLDREATRLVLAGALNEIDREETEED